jgi:hypothetical protein
MDAELRLVTDRNFTSAITVSVYIFVKNVMPIHITLVIFYIAELGIKKTCTPGKC